MKQRSQYLDILRGSALILMVFGHCLQYGNGTEFIKNSGFFYNRLFQVIYSFHMPLFILLSGYLFFYTAGKYQKNSDFLKNRWQRIFLPIIGWQTFHYLVNGMRMLGKGEMITPDYFLRYVRSWFTDIWFLLAILYCSLVVFCVRKYFKDSLIIYFLGFVLTFITPDSMANLHLYKFMYPFFVCGYLFGRYLDKASEMISRIGLKYLFTGILAVFVILFCFWDTDAYIYTTGYTLLWRENTIRQFVIDIYRMLIGFAGSAVAVFGIKLLYDWKASWLSEMPWKKIFAVLWQALAGIGRNSLCIYILSSEMVHWFLEAYSDYFHFSYLGTIMQTVTFIAVCYLVSVWISRVPILNKFLLGGK